ncbi:hypothetical protein [Flavobacterium sp.]|uniref:hypothetical protein n=1 Tax=Flavobacterium sp. TaxID=239 RepID=UPI003D0C76F3
MINIINQLFEIEKKAKDQNISIFERNFDRLNTEISDLGYMVENPLGKKYDARDTSIEANVAGSSPNPTIVKVLKPIIFHKEGEQIILVQKGIVIAE